MNSWVRSWCASVNTSCSRCRHGGDQRSRISARQGSRRQPVGFQGAGRIKGKADPQIELPRDRCSHRAMAVVEKRHRWVWPHRLASFVLCSRVGQTGIEGVGGVATSKCWKNHAIGTSNTTATSMTLFIPCTHVSRVHTRVQAQGAPEGVQQAGSRKVRARDENVD